MDLSNSVTPSPPLTMAAVRGWGGRGGGEENKKMLIYGNVLRFLASYSEKQSTLLEIYLQKNLQCQGMFIGGGTVPTHPNKIIVESLINIFFLLVQSAAVTFHFARLRGCKTKLSCCIRTQTFYNPTEKKQCGAGEDFIFSLINQSSFICTVLIKKII